MSVPDFGLKRNFHLSLFGDEVFVGQPRNLLRKR